MKFPLVIILQLLTARAVSNGLNLYADSLHAPFYYGVASGDPGTDRVVLWTHLTSTNPFDTVYYEVAVDTTFSALVSNGLFITNDSLDHTVKIDVIGLNAGFTYYYRFLYQGLSSTVGRTKTAPASASGSLNFAVISCSSIYSGFFNAYRQLAIRDDLNGIIHLGDYIYDDMVANEEVRVPDSLPVNPQNIYDWRKIHKLWLLDPDLRFARQNHPFIQLWDNHDTDGLHFDCKESSEAFMNYTPVRANPLNYQKIYRQLSYGNLLDVIILDVALWRGIDTISASQDSYLGNEQFDWFKNTIRSSGARWKVVGSQKMFNNWNVVIGGGANANAWDGFPAERNRVLNVIDSNRINNVIFISGDSHVSIGADLPYMPYNNSTYNQSTGEGSLCVEFAPASISRGNFDEKGLPQALINTVLETSNQVNRHHQYADLTKHGYGILRFTEDSARAQFWYCDIQNISNLNELGKELVLINGENHWKRNAALNTSSHEMQEEQGIVVSKPYPNPAQNEVHLDIEMAQPADIQLSIYQIINPKKINFQSSSRVAVSKHSHLSLPIDHLPIGAYMLLVECGDYYKGQLFIKM